MRNRTRLPSRASNGVVSGADTPLKVSQNNSIIVVYARRRLFLRMRDEKSEQPHHFLHRAVRVIEKGSFLMHRKFVRKFFSRRGRFLANPRHAVLFDRDLESVPVQGSALRQLVFKNDSDAFALLHLNRRSGAASVVAPHVERLPWNDCALYGLRDEMEHLHIAVHLEGKIAYVRRAHRNRRPTFASSLALAFSRLATRSGRTNLRAQTLRPCKQPRAHQRRVPEKIPA